MKNVEDIYPLSPMQELMLVQTLTTGSDTLSELSCWELYGQLDSLAFQRAWQYAIKRHTGLRTAFLWGNLKKPLQVVRQQVKLRWEQQDWQNQNEQEQQERFQDLQKAQQQRDINVSQAPLLYFTLVQRTADAWYFLISFHHLLMDAWSASILIEEVLVCYEAFRAGQEPHLVPAPGYRAYIEWLQQQNQAEAEAFWKRTLQGFSVPTPLPNDQAANSHNENKEKYQSREIRFSLAALRASAQRYQITLNTLVQGAWALILSQYSSQSDIVFGVTVSGRPAELSRVEEMVGLFINNLPIRVHIQSDDALATWIKHLQEDNSEQRQYEYCPLMQIHQWSEMPRSQRLFNSLLVFENYPRQDTKTGVLEMRNLKGSGRTGYPLAIFVEIEQDLSLLFSYDAHYFNEDCIIHLLGSWNTMLEALTTLDKKDVLIQHLSSLLKVPEQSVVEDISASTRHNTSNQMQVSIVEPRSEMELQLTHLWKDVLGVHPISVTDDFFSLGGHSFLAMHLIDQIQQRFQRSFSAQDIFQATTIERMARVLEQQSSTQSWSPIVAIQPTGCKPPLFYVHPAPGSVFCYINLARQLGEDQPFYGLQALGVDGTRSPLHDMKAMAAYYIDAIRTVQPQGPYYLGGHSFGGLVAFEMAQQLQQQGQLVAFLLIMDVAAPSQQMSNNHQASAQSSSGDRSIELQDVAKMIERFLGAHLDIRPERLTMLNGDQQLAYFLKQAQAANFFPAHASVDSLLGLLQVLKANGQAYQTYKPGVYSNQIILFRSSIVHPDDYAEVASVLDSPTLGWSEFSTKPIDTYTIQGDHISMLMDPYVQGLAAQLRLCLEQAQKVEANSLPISSNSD